MSKTQAGSKPAKTTRAKPADKTKAAKPATRQPKKPAATSRAQRPTTARKPSSGAKLSARWSAEAPPLGQPPGTASNRIYPSSLYDVATPIQASALYGGLTKSEVRRVRKQFYAAGRPDLAAAPRSVSQLLP